MGLDLVELIMEVEETFGISLPDARLPKIRTVGELCDCIVGIVSRKKEEIGLRSEMFKSLLESLPLARGTSAKRVSEDTLLDEVIPVWGRRRTWKRLQKSLDAPLPALHRPRSVKIIVAIAAVLLGGATSFGMVGAWEPSRMLAVAKAEGYWVMFGAPAFLWGLLCYWLSKPTAVVWPANLETIGDLTRALVIQKYGAVLDREKAWTREEIWGILRGVVVDVLGVESEAVTREARFVEDLGAD